VIERIIGRRCLPLEERGQPATLIKVSAARSPLLARRNAMSYRIAGIHKKMLAVVVSDVEIESEYSV